MALRCDNCKHWVETVFLGQSASGYGCWEGVCQNPEVPRPGPGQRDRHNLMLACPKFEDGAHPRSIAGGMATAQLRQELAAGDWYDAPGVAPSGDVGRDG